MTRTMPPEDEIEFDFSGQLRGTLARKFATECERRRVEPATLHADLLEAIINDDLFAAILDR